MSSHKKYKEIKKDFSSERIEEIKKGADTIRKELDILHELSKLAGVTEEKLIDILQTKYPYFSENNELSNLTLNGLMQVIVALGCSIDITINFPEKTPMQFSQVENFFLKEEETKYLVINKHKKK
ncbi:XRE family transcriptional regulator [Gloeocapsa sp. PCC 73106]|uniref:XRE family transcriptional regulator n=1 Tax=Gloeocapsa sp. PCC 73106 TaxID=102232 RepID=UPI0002AC6DEE|nr:XRE family transcriptional regulator [Gloeocapsa sp. PCC 73106]ELR98374.1 hypothetical protein GLO73106DRAFT_00022050 [Gloeocapsa sp. PCC 73106]